ncbi:MAG: response regulator [Deltaproteobacteria bacterium]|nr:response regulator [Deltaproteobacteria bacterium]
MALTRDDNKGKYILVVDDDPFFRNAVSFEFKNYGFEVLNAENGLNALEVLDKNPAISLVITDIKMPVHDGLYFLKEVRAKGNLLPVILMSGFADVPFWDGYDIGADAWLGKPFHFETLEKLIEKVTQAEENRWKKTSLKPRQTLTRVYSNEKETHGEDGFQLGRGGIFVAGEHHSLSMGEAVQFNLLVEDSPSSSLSGIGTVRWVRDGKVGELAPGCGIEIEFLDENIRLAVIKYINTLKPTAFIPKGLKAQTK